jgi:hypothetical protein
MLSNAQAAQRFMALAPIDLGEAREILKFCMTSSKTTGARAK